MLLAITVAVAVGRCQELMPWHGKNNIQTIFQILLTLFYFVWTVSGAQLAGDD
jgi:hypothetical protein